MYIILEIQTYLDGTTGTLINPYTDRNEAESNFHRVLMAAAVSDVPKHAAVMLTEEGRVLRNECYKHESEVEPDEETTN